MVSSPRKQREILQRNELILKVAREILLERGYLGLTMDRIAAATEYSKGTIYQHFANKEEVVIALAIETTRVRAKLFERAATFKGRPRERMAALGVAAETWLRLHPDHFRSEQISRASSVKEKISPEKKRELEMCERRCMEIATGIVRDAVAAGDLVLSEDATPEVLTFGLWSMSYGVFTVVATDQFPLEELGVHDPFGAVRTNQQMMLDGYGWKPLSNEWDWDETMARILTEVFPEEIETIQLQAGASK